MSITKSFLAELDHELATTRALLERVPFDQADWKPHPKSMSLGKLATHLVDLVGLGIGVLTQPAVDLGTAPTAAGVASTAELLARFDEQVKVVREALAGTEDASMGESWTMTFGSHTIATLPRAAAMRSAVLNHLIHHRGQLSVYLRLKDVPLPPMYGPTADS